jgi:hypothetical protein
MSPSTKRQRAAPPEITPETKRMIFDAIAAAASPISAADLGNIAAPGRKLTGTRVKAVLAEDVAAGLVFLWGDAKSKAYWHRDPSGVARERLLRIAGDEAVASKELEQRAAAEWPTIAPKLVKLAHKQLEAEKRFRKIGGVVVDVEHPQPYLEAEIARLLKAFGIERGADRIRGLLGSGEAARKAPRAAESVEEVAAKIFATLNRIAFSPGTTVTFYRLRQDPDLAAIPKDVFDQAALLLQRERRALLSVHDHAAALPAAEQQRLVTDGLGTYYVSIYAR